MRHASNRIMASAGVRTWPLYVSMPFMAGPSLVRPTRVQGVAPKSLRRASYEQAVGPSTKMRSTPARIERQDKRGVRARRYQLQRPSQLVARIPRKWTGGEGLREESEKRQARTAGGSSVEASKVARMRTTS